MDRSRSPIAAVASAAFASIAARRSQTSPALVSYACTVKRSSAEGKTPATRMNPRDGSMFHSFAATTRVTPRGARSISSTSTGRPLIKLTRVVAFGGGFNTRGVTGPPDESIDVVVGRATSDGISSGETPSECSAGWTASDPIAAAALARARARRIDPSNAALAARSSSLDVAVVTAAVPTHSSPTNTATRYRPLIGRLSLLSPPGGGSANPGERIFNRILSPSTTSTLVSLTPGRGTSIIPCRVQTLTVPPFTLRSSLFTLTKTPLALPRGGSRPSFDKPNGSSPSVAYSVPCPCASTSCRSLTVTAAVEPSPTPVTTMGSWSGGGMSTHWLGCGALTCTTPAGETISSGGAPSSSFSPVPSDASARRSVVGAMRDIRPGLGPRVFSGPAPGSTGTAASTLAAAVSWSSSSSMRARVDSAGGFVASFGTFVSSFGTFVSSFGTFVSSFGTFVSSSALVSFSSDAVTSASSVVAPLSA